MFSTGFIRPALLCALVLGLLIAGWSLISNSKLDTSSPEEVSASASTPVSAPEADSQEFAPAQMTDEDLQLVLEQAEQGDADNQYVAGVLYQRGELVLLNESQAAYWYKRAAEQDHPAAALSLGKLYDRGAGVPQNDRSAVEWYRRAAKLGLPDAQYNLAAMYDQGRGVAQSFVDAAAWYKKSARQQYMDAQINLASMYWQGQGVEKSVERSYMWFFIASELGYPSGHESLVGVAELMTEDQVEAAVAFARECMESDYTECGD